MRKVYVTLTVDAIIMVNDGVDISEAINESELSMVDNLDRMDVIDMNIRKMDITESK